MIKILREKIKNFLNSPDWDNPRFILIMTVGAYLVFVLIRFLLFSFFGETCANGDEYTYKGMALSFFKYGDFYKMNYARKLILPNYLYPLLISPAFFFGEHFYIFMKLINSILINLSIFPVFLMAREFMNNRRAFLTSLLVLVIPFFNIGYAVMAESLYLPLFLFVFYLTYKLLVSMEIKFLFLNGFFLALLYLTKPNALLFVVSLLFTFILFLFMLRDSQQRKKLILFVLLTIGVSFFCIIVINYLFLGSPDLKLKFYSKWPANAFVDIESKITYFFSAKSLYVFLSHISIFLILYLLPFYIAFISFKNAIKRTEIKPMIFSALGLIFFLIMFFYVTVITSGFAKLLKLQARYYFMIFPFFIIAFFAFFDKVDWKSKSKIVVALFFVLTVMINLFIFIPKIVLAGKGFGLLAHMDAYWIYIGFTKWGLLGKVFFFLVLIIGFLTLFYYIFQRGKKLYPIIVFFLIVAAISNFGLWQRMNFKNERMLKFRKNYLSFVSEKIPEHSQEVAWIGRKKSFGIMGYFSFWLHYDYTYKKKFHKGEKAILTRDMIPENSRWILIDGDYEIKFSVKKHFRKGNYSIVQVF